MAPYVPEEVDVYTVPHLRMKELMNDCVEILDTTNFSKDADMNTVLGTLIRSFIEFKNHEMIENTIIMKKLKHKLKKLSIRNSAVCNCHKDSHLVDMLRILKDGFNKKTEQDRKNYRMQLRMALEEFADDFLPHMKEEEETFGPLLLKYFSYDELKEMKNKVIQRHFEEKEDQVANVIAAEELDKWAQEQVQDISSSSACESDDDKQSALQTLQDIALTLPKTSILDLPPEINLKIMSYLNPPELCRCAQVCKSWSVSAMTPSLWKDLYPVKWAKGEWNFHYNYNELVEEDEEEEDAKIEEEPYIVIDDDADVDESEMADEEEQSTMIQQLQREGKILLGLKNYVVPKVGEGVSVLDLSNSRALTNGVLKKILQHCPNLETLDLTQTRVTDSALKGLGKNYCCSYLRHLILTGCSNVSDKTLIYFAMAFNKPLLDPENLSDSAEELGEDCVCSKYKRLKEKIETKKCAINVDKNGKCTKKKKVPTATLR